jgi:hypothetical protein
MISAWKMTRSVSPTPPSFRFVPEVTLIGLCPADFGAPVAALVAAPDCKSKPAKMTFK